MKEVYSTLESQCKKTIEHFHTQLSGMRTGRATTKMLENIMVDYYGTQTPLNQLGMLNAPEPRQLTVQIYDAGALDAAEKAIQNSELGLNPARDGNLIRIPVPALTEDRRKEIVKALGKEAEDSKISVRNHRREAIDQIKKLKDSKEIGEDEQKKAQDEIQKVTDKYIKEIDGIMSEKEKEIMTV